MSYNDFLALIGQVRGVLIIAWPLIVAAVMARILSQEQTRLTSPVSRSILAVIGFGIGLVAGFAGALVGYEAAKMASSDPSSFFDSGRVFLGAIFEIVTLGAVTILIGGGGLTFVKLFLPKAKYESPPQSVPTAVEPVFHGSIFISYRRSDNQDATDRMYDRLVQAFGSNAIFKDVDNIPQGVDFRLALNQYINSCHAVLVVIGDKWLDIGDSRGNRRLDDPNDFVRYEVETALHRNVIVVPVLLGRTPMPPPDRLPPEMQQLVYRNAAIVRPDPDFHRDMDRLIESLQQSLGGRSR